MIEVDDLFVVLSDKRSAYDAERNAGDWTIMTTHKNIDEAFIALWELRASINRSPGNNARPESTEQMTMVARFNFKEPFALTEPHE